MSYIEEWKDCKLINILKQNYNSRTLVFKNKKGKIRITLSSLNFKSTKFNFCKGIFYDISRLGGGKTKFGSFLTLSNNKVVSIEKISNTISKNNYFSDISFLKISEPNCLKSKR